MAEPFELSKEERDNLRKKFSIRMDLRAKSPKEEADKPELIDPPKEEANKLPNRFSLRIDDDDSGSSFELKGLTREELIKYASQIELIKQDGGRVYWDAESLMFRSMDENLS